MSDTNKKAIDFAFNERVTGIIAELDTNTTFSDENDINVKDFDKTVYSRLPKGCTVEMLTELADLSADVSLAVTASIGGAITRRAIENPDIGKLEWRGHTENMDYGVSYSRPTVKKPTRRHHENALTSYTGIRKHDDEIEVKSKLADLWE